MAKRRRIGTSICLLGMAIFLVVQGVWPNVTIELPGQLPRLNAMPGDPIQQEDLDGMIGPEWADTQGHEVRLGKYEAEIRLKHDGEFLYIAMIIKTHRRFSRGFEAYVVFDNGDARDYSRDDDIILVVEESGWLYEADYYYRGQYDFWLDTDVGGENNAYGAGKYDSAKQWYVFEFMKELLSGDAKDIPLSPGEVATAIYGWASY